MDESRRRRSPDPLARRGSPRARRPLRPELADARSSTSGGRHSPYGGASGAAVPVTPPRSRRATIGAHIKAGFTRWRLRLSGDPGSSTRISSETAKAIAVLSRESGTERGSLSRPPIRDPHHRYPPRRVGTPHARAPRGDQPERDGEDLRAKKQTPEAEPADSGSRSDLELAESPLQSGTGVLVQPPATPHYVLRIARATRLQGPLFDVNPRMHFTDFGVQGARSFGGSGGYGEVELLRGHRLAVKTVKAPEWFRVELVATLLAGDCATRARRSLGISGIIVPLAFSLSGQQIVFRAYDMDLSHYVAQLAVVNSRDPRIPQSVERRFVEMARAINYLNTSCGLTHLDIKGANILVDLESDALCLRRAVLADFSLLTLNTNSVVAGARFSLWCHDRGALVAFGMPAALTTANFHTLVGHAYNQPPELLIKYVNNERAEFRNRPLDHECGLATDMYALGQALLELIMTAYVVPELGIPITRVPGYQYYNNELSLDFAIAVLAYRCHLHRAFFPSTPETSLYGPPFDSPDVIRRRLRSSRHKRAFSARFHSFGATHRAPLSAVVLRPDLLPLAVLAALFCHSDPRARSATSRIWV
ncbi:tegument serine/threonine protein kinase [Saimiriine alphaherpesvirus 1]|uniref:Tegument serine/threonine protein kinase n=1 Tax=Saimiriine herpesvirus 1 (strain MV-5-4-PSL) TaxID=10353 RepID=E2IUF7_SHV1|nr:tegument serine/threonine protein kinase [Saimiriine alphaherpesvirus 1]ADO13815.1 tegument serine/threonine protein kinase [Saimiriine alphaherpesvirus 1]